MIKTPEMIFKALLGQWTVHRQITPGGVFEGQAKFTSLSNSRALYEESGTLTLDHGAVLEPSKRYEWRLEGGGIAIYFADGETKGELFHILNFEQRDKARAHHLCGVDIYQSAYQFNLPNKLSITHHVSGPQKDYISLTQLTRAK